MKWRAKINEIQMLLHKYRLPSGNQNYRTKNCLVDRKPRVVMGTPEKPQSKETTISRFILWTVAPIALLLIFPYSHRFWSLTWPTQPSPPFLQGTHMSSASFLTHTHNLGQDLLCTNAASHPFLWILILSRKWVLNVSYGNLLYFSCTL